MADAHVRGIHETATESLDGDFQVHEHGAAVPGDPTRKTSRPTPRDGTLVPSIERDTKHRGSPAGRHVVDPETEGPAAGFVQVPGPICREPVLVPGEVAHHRSRLPSAHFSRPSLGSLALCGLGV